MMLISSFSSAQQRDSTFYSYTKIGYEYDFFNQQLNDWHNLTAEVKFERNQFTFLPRLTLANRFDQSSFLFESDFYKSFDNRDYIMAGFGLSPGSIFVKNQLTLEYFNPFGKWEHSIGLRWMNFENTGSLGVITGSLSRYYGSFLTSLRGNFAYGFKEDNFNNFAIILTHRYYFSDSGYIGLLGAYGYDPNLILISDQNIDLSGKPDQLTLGASLHTSNNKNKQWTLSYQWINYDFVVYERQQHSISLFITLHER